MADRTITVPGQGAGPASYTLAGGEAFTLRSVTWRQSVAAPVSAGAPAVPEMLAYSPEGLLIGRISAPAVASAAPQAPPWSADFTATPSPGPGIGPAFVETITSTSPTVFYLDPGLTGLPLWRIDPNIVQHATLVIHSITASSALLFGAFSGAVAPFVPGGASRTFNAVGTYTFDVNPGPVLTEFRVNYNAIPFPSPGLISFTFTLQA